MLSHAVTPASTPREGTEDSATHLTPPQLGSRMTEARGGHKGSTILPTPPPCPSSQAPCKAQSFAGDFKWLLVRRCSQGWESGTQGCSQGWERGKRKKNSPGIANGWFGELQGGLHEGSAQGSDRSQPLPDLLKVQQD